MIEKTDFDLPLIGPHEGRELELMLAGKKSAAMFYDVFPSEEFLPKAQFAPYVAKGAILMKETLFDAKKSDCIINHVYYALPHEFWRIAELEKLQLSALENNADYAAIDRAVGKLLDYPDQAIDFFIEKNSKKTQLA